MSQLLLNKIARIWLPRMVITGLALGTVSTGALASPITVDSNSTRVIVFDDATNDLVSDIFTGITIPTSTSISVSTGLSSSTTAINWSGDNNSAQFSYNFEQSIDNTDGASSYGCCDLAQSVDNRLVFTAAVDSTYELSGFFAATNAIEMRVFMNASLRDVTAGSAILFQDISESRSTANESFSLGASALDGDFDNFLTGNLTGLLIAGHQYDFFFNYYIQAVDANPAESYVAANSLGNVTLNIHGVPEPATITLLLLGLLGLGSIRNSHRS